MLVRQQAQSLTPANEIIDRILHTQVRFVALLFPDFGPLHDSSLDIRAMAEIPRVEACNLRSDLIALVCRFYPENFRPELM